MVVEAIHPDTGEKIFIDIPSLDKDKVDDMIKEHATEAKINSYIQKLGIPAEAKALIMRISKYTIKVGEITFRMGKKILEIVIMLTKKYPKATFGVIFGALLTFLIGFLPLIGSLLASFLGPLLMLLGLAKGLWEDMKKTDPDIAASITNVGEVFEPLSAV